MILRFTLILGSLCILCAAQNPQRRDTVVVTGTYEPVPLEEADRPVRLLEVDEESRLLANSLVDFLKLDASLDLRQRAPNNIQGDLSIRGGGFGQTLVLLNGLRMNDPQTGHHNLNLPLPPDSLEKIEVLKGSGSTLYGSDAVGGVVNFITRAPEAVEFRLRGAMGNYGVNQQRGTFSVADRRWGQQLHFSRDFSSGFRENRDYRNLSLATVSRLSSALGESEVLLAHADRPFGADQFYGRFNSWERTKTWFAGLRQGIGERTQASLAFRRHTDLFVLYRDRPQVYTNRHAVESYQAAVRRWEPLSTNARLHYGVEGFRDSIVSNNLGSHRRSRGAGFAGVDVRAARRFSFSAGARQEFYSNLRGQFSPTLAAGVWLSSQLKLRASASRAFRLPSYTDLYYHDPANRGSADLRPETAWTYEAGLDWNAAGRLRTEVTWFQRRERDGIDYVRANAQEIWRATNFRRLRFDGVEASLTTLVAGAHRLGAHYTALRGAQAHLGGLQSKYVFNYPVHSATATWQAALPGGVVGRSRFGALQRRGRSAYAVWDVYLAARHHRLRPFAQFTNLTNTAYQEILGVDMPGRAAVAGIELVVFGRGN